MSQHPKWKLTLDLKTSGVQWTRTNQDTSEKWYYVLVEYIVETYVLKHRTDYISFRPNVWCVQALSFMFYDFYRELEVSGGRWWHVCHRLFFRWDYSIFCWCSRTFGKIKVREVIYEFRRVCLEIAFKRSLTL